MAITDWPLEERPREKLLQRGASALSDAELLAIFLRTGVKGKSAVDLARDLLSHFGGLRRLLESNQGEFCEAQGLGSAKYSQLQAVLEMSRRHLAATLEQKPCLTSTSAVKQYVSAQLRHKHQEVFALILLNSQNQLIKFVELFNGTIDAASVYPREVVKTALSHNAAAVILAHNHPSGIAEPSEPDKAITKRLQQALQLVDIRTLDHFVVGDAETVSFAERGWI